MVMISVKKASPHPLHFPMLLVHKMRGSVWLFLTSTTGVCLDPSGGLYKIGETETGLDTGNFEPYRGTITMENTQ